MWILRSLVNDVVMFEEACSGNAFLAKGLEAMEGSGGDDESQEFYGGGVKLQRMRESEGKKGSIAKGKRGSVEGERGPFGSLCWLHCIFADKLPLPAGM